MHDSIHWYKNNRLGLIFDDIDEEFIPTYGDVYLAKVMGKVRPAMFLHFADDKFLVIPMTSRRNNIGEKKKFDKKINKAIKKKHNPFLEKNSIAVVSQISSTKLLKNKLGRLREKDIVKIQSRIEDNFVRRENPIWCYDY